MSARKEFVDQALIRYYSQVKCEDFPEDKELIPNNLNLRVRNIATAGILLAIDSLGMKYPDCVDLFSFWNQSSEYLQAKLHTELISLLLPDDPSHSPDTSSFDRIWDNEPAVIGKLSFDGLANLAGLDKEDDHYPHEIVGLLGFQNHLNILKSLLPVEIDQSVFDMTPDEFRSYIEPGLDKQHVQYDADMAEYLEELLNRQEYDDSDGNGQKLAELKARFQAMLWSVCQPFRFVKETYVDHKQPKSTRLSSELLLPYDEMLAESYAKNLKKYAGDSRRAFAFTFWNFLKDLAE